VDSQDSRREISGKFAASISFRDVGKRRRRDAMGDGASHRDRLQERKKKCARAKFGVTGVERGEDRQK